VQPQNSTSNRTIPVTYCVTYTLNKKHICFNKEYGMYEDSCLVYAFSDTYLNNLEKDLTRFKCEVHSFHYDAVRNLCMEIADKVQ